MQFCLLNIKRRQEQSKQQNLEQLMLTLSLDHEIKQQLHNLEHQGHEQTEVWKIGKMLQLLLSDQKLYQNASLKHLVKASKNGWIPIEEILSIQSLQGVFQQLKLFKNVDKKLLTKFIHIHFKNFNSNLKTNKRSIKRKVPFLDKMKNVKPIYIQNYPKDSEMKTIKKILNNLSEVYKVKWNLGCKSAYVYVQKPQEVVDFFLRQNSFQMQWGQQKSNNLNIDVISYENLIDTINFLEQIEQRDLRLFLNKTFLSNFIKNQAQEIAQNFRQENEIIRRLQQNINHTQNIDRLRQQNNNFMNHNIEEAEARMNRSRQEEEDFYYYDGYQDIRNINFYRSKRSRNIGKVKVNEKINKIMQDIRTYYLPNMNFNKKLLLTKNQKQQTIHLDKNYQFIQSKLKFESQNLIDTLLQQKYKQMIQI